MRKTIVTCALILVSIVAFTLTFNQGRITGAQVKTFAGPSGAVLHTGTHGGVTWEVYENNHLLFKPANGVEGTFGHVNYNSNFRDYKGIVESVSFMPGVKSGSSLYAMFHTFIKVKEIDLTNFDTSNATNMASMFFGAKKLETFIPGDTFYTSNVTNMHSMFLGITSLEHLELGEHFDTSNVVSMYRMFYTAKSLISLDLGPNFDTSNVKNMAVMFSYLPKLTSLNLGDKFNTENVTDMGSMFNSLKSLETLDLGDKFDTSNVKAMGGFISGNNILKNLNLGDKFDTSSVTNMNNMFMNNSQLEFLDLGDKFTTANVTTMNRMFEGSNMLKKIVFDDMFEFKNDTGLVSPNESGYTGKWIKEDRTAGPYTVQQMHTNPADLHGTWVWEIIPQVDVNIDFKFEGGYNILPETIEIKLYKDGVDTGETLTAEKADIDSNTGMVNVDFGEHPKYSDEAQTQEIIYTAELTNAIDNFTKVNQHHYKYTSPKIDITIEKAWVHGSTLIPDTIDVKLKRNGTDFRTITVTRDNSWSILVEDLDKTDNNGDNYTYTVEEITNIEGFTGTVNNFEITNTYASPIIDVTDDVLVNGGTKLLPDTITIELYKDGVATGETKTISKADLLDGIENVSFEDVDKTDIEGNSYTYDIKVSASNSLPDGFTIDSDGNLNYTSPASDLEANIKYIEGEALRQNITITLKREANGSIETVRETVVNVNDFDQSGTSILSYDDMPNTDNDGNTYTYFIEGTDVDHFTKAINGMNATYTYEEELIDITANIIFSGGANANKPDTITVKIKNGNTVVEEKEVDVNDSDVIFEDLPSRDSNNNYEEIEYTLESDEINNFNLVVYNEAKTITYTYVIPRGDITKPIVKEGGEPAQIVVKLIKDGVPTGETVTINSGENATYPDMPLTDNDGNPITYTVKVDMTQTNLPDGYTVETGDDGNDKVVYTSPKREYTEQVKRIGGKPIDIVVELLKDGVVVPGSKETIQSGSSNTWNNLDKTDSNANPYNYDLAISDETVLPDGYTIEADENGDFTVRYESPKQMLEITKKWVDGEEVRPEAILVMIKQNDGDFKEVRMSKADHMVDPDTWVIEVLVDKTDTNADDYTYSVEERIVEGFTPEYSQEGLTITNIYVVPLDIIKSQVVFVGGSDRPSVTVQLKDEDGNIVQEKDAVMVDGKLIATFEDVPRTKADGSLRTYTVNAKDIPENYTENVSGKVITLTYVSPKIDVDIPVNIPDDYHGNITVELIKDGVPTGITITKSADEIRADGGKVTFEDVDKTDNDGNDYAYTGNVKTDIPGYDKEKDENGNNTTFVYTGSPKDITITTSYVGGSSLPREDMTVDILANGEAIKTVTVNDVETIVKDMLTYDRAGNLIEHSTKITNKDEMLEKHFEASEIGEKHLKVEYIIPKGDKDFNVIYQGLNGSNAPTVKVVLIANGTRTEKVITLNNGNTEAIFKGLPPTDKEGNEIKYIVDVLGKLSGYTKKVSSSGKTILIIKDETNSEYIPHAGAKENFAMVIILLALIAYARRNLKIFNCAVNPNKFDGFVSFRDK